MWGLNGDFSQNEQFMLVAPELWKEMNKFSRGRVDHWNYGKEKSFLDSSTNVLFIVIIRITELLAFYNEVLQLCNQNVIFGLKLVA